MMKSGLVGLKSNTYSYPLFALTLTIVGSRLAHYLFPSEPTFRGQPPSIWVAIGGSAVGLILAITSRRLGNSARIPKIWVYLLALLVLAWLSSLAMMRIHEDLFAISTILVPTAVFALVLVLPTPSEIRSTLVFFAATVLLGVAATMIAASAGIRPFREDFEGRVPLPGLEAFRWEAYFGDANNAGTIMAMTLLIAILKGGKAGWALGLPSAAILLLSQSRTGVAAAVLGVTVMVVASWHRKGDKTWLIGFTLVGVVGSILLLILVVDPTLNGRVLIWRDFLGIWGASPVIGLGFQGIQEQVPGMTGLAQDAHNVLLDPLVRHGLAPFLFAAAFLVIAGFASASRGLSNKGFPLAMYVTGMTCFMSYTTFGWAYMTLFMWPFLLASMLPTARQVSEFEGTPASLQHTAHNPSA